MPAVLELQFSPSTLVTHSLMPAQRSKSQDCISTFQVPGKTAIFIIRKLVHGYTGITTVGWLTVILRTLSLAWGPLNKYDMRPAWDVTIKFLLGTPAMSQSSSTSLLRNYMNLLDTVTSYTIVSIPKEEYNLHLPDLLRSPSLLLQMLLDKSHGN